MLNELIKNTKKYYWILNPDGDVVLGRNDIEPKSKVTFTLTKRWANVAPIVEKSPGHYMGKPANFLKKSKEYEQIVELTKIVKAYLKSEPRIDHEKTFKNTMKLLYDFYNKSEVHD